MSPTGHLAAGFFFRSLNRRPALLLCLLLANFLDLLYMTLVALGLESQAYAPWSHSLVMALVWSLAAGGAGYIIFRSSKAGLITGAVLFSHWLLDFLVWSTNLVTFDPGLRVGFGLYDLIGFRLENAGWNTPSILATGLELSLLAVGAMAWFFRRNLNQPPDSPTPPPGTP